jgi:hypothetical protein
VIIVLPLALLLSVMFLLAFVYSYWWALLPVAAYFIWRDQRCTCQGGNP